MSEPGQISFRYTSRTRFYLTYLILIVAEVVLFWMLHRLLLGMEPYRRLMAYVDSTPTVTLFVGLLLFSLAAFLLIGLPMMVAGRSTERRGEMNLLEDHAELRLWGGVRQVPYRGASVSCEYFSYRYNKRVQQNSRGVMWHVYAVHCGGKPLRLASSAWEFSQRQRAGRGAPLSLDLAMRALRDRINPPGEE